MSVHVEELRSFLETMQQSQHPKGPRYCYGGYVRESYITLFPNTYLPKLYTFRSYFQDPKNTRLDRHT